MEIEVYTLEGQLVHFQSADTPGQVIWELTTSTNILVASGVYLVRVRNGDASVTLPISIIR